MDPIGLRKLANASACCSYAIPAGGRSVYHHPSPQATLKKPHKARVRAVEPTAEVAISQDAAVKPLSAVEAHQGEPILSGGGGGIFFFWQLGVVKYLEEHYDLTKVQVRGASAGALLATLAACNVEPRRALDSAHQLAVDARLWDRKLKLAGVWGGLIRAWLYELLPNNAADLVRDRLQLVVTDVRARFRQVVIKEFDNNKDLVEANMASVHVPFFLDWQPFAWYRGRPYIDGSLADFVRGDNSDWLTCGGQAVVLDYFQDDQLSYNRASFLKLPSHEGAVDLMDKGYRFAERVAATGEYERKLGSARRSAISAGADTARHKG